MTPTHQDISAALSDVLKSYDVEKAFLFGSYSRGDQTPDSDVDIRLQCGHSIRINDLVEIEKALSERLGLPVDIVSADPKHLRKHFYNEIAKDEVLLYAA